MRKLVLLLLVAVLVVPAAVAQAAPPETTVNLSVPLVAAASSGTSCHVTAVVTWEHFHGPGRWVSLIGTAEGDYVEEAFWLSGGTKSLEVPLSLVAGETYTLTASLYLAKRNSSGSLATTQMDYTCG